VKPDGRVWLYQVLGVVLLLTLPLLAACGSKSKPAQDRFPTVHLSSPDAEISTSDGVTWVSVSEEDVISSADCETIKRQALYDQPNIGRVGVVVVHSAFSSTVCAAP
jgi:hypothetical protein